MQSLEPTLQHTTGGRMIAALATICAALVVLATWQAQAHIEREARADLGRALQSILHTSHKALQDRLSHHLETAQVWAESPRIQQLGFALLPIASDPAALRAAPEQAQLRATFATASRVVGYERMALIGPGNVVLAAQVEKDTGLRIPASEQTAFLARVWAGEPALALPEPAKERLERRHWLFVGTPIRDPAGTVRTVLAFSIDMDRDFGTLLEQGRVGRTGETYAFDAYARMLTRSHFEEPLQHLGLLPPGESSVFNIVLRDPGVDLTRQSGQVVPDSKAPLTRMAAAAVAGVAGMDLDGYRDYRGVPVVGAWLWDAEDGIGIATEQDRDEAYGAANTIIAILHIAALLVLSLLALAVYSHVLYRRNRASHLALEHYQSQLEQLVEARTAELRRSNAELEDYSYSIAHDLRQPLRGITSFSQILREEAASRLDTDQRALLDRIAAAGLRMSELIDAILELARIARLPLQPRLVDVSTLAESLAAESRTHGNRYPGSISIRPGMRAMADPTLLEAALRELLSNALKFSASRPDARVEFYCEEHADCPTFIVQDNGCGIDMRYADRLFRPFSRLHDDATVPGRGIGLAIARRVVERHGGTIVVDSSPGGGTAVRFTLAPAHA